MNPAPSQLALPDGTELYVADYLLPANEARGGVVIMHGLGEHCGRYRHLARFLNDAGWSVRTYDHRGHGRSSGGRGDVRTEGDILSDGKAIIDAFSQRLGAPPFLLGHSMGGLFAADFALAALSPLRGLILSSPALAVPMTAVQTMLLKVMHTVAPHMGVPNGLQPKFLSHDETVVDAYLRDPLVHGKISATLLSAMLRAVNRCSDLASTLSIPALMLVAGDDHLVNAEGSKRFFSKLTPGRAEFNWYEHSYHEVFNEPDRDRPLADLRNWLAAQEAL
jgi:alpha-beta hydrolase superfamily lysophospholipase